MTSSLVQALPSINSSLLGLFGALYAAYAIYKKQENSVIYQKIINIESRIENLCSEDDSYAPHQASPESLLYTEQGYMDFRFKVDIVSFLLDHMEKNNGDPYGFPDYRTYGSSSDKKITSLRIAEILDDLIRLLNYSMKKFLYEKRLNNQDALQIFSSQLKKLSSISNNREQYLENLIEIATQERHKNSPWNRISYKKKFLYFSSSIDICQKYLIPELNSLIKIPKILDPEVNLSIISRHSIYLMSWILVFGIFFPILIPDLPKDLNQLSPGVWEFISSAKNVLPVFTWKYFLLFLNLAPYILLLFWLKKKTPAKKKFLVNKFLWLLRSNIFKLKTTILKMKNPHI